MPALFDEQVGRAERIFELGDRLPQLVGVGHVSCDEGGRSSAVVDQLRRQLQFVGRAGDEGDRRARVGEGVSEHEAEAATAAGDECHRAGQRLATGCERWWGGERGAGPPWVEHVHGVHGPKRATAVVPVS